MPFVSITGSTRADFRDNLQAMINFSRAFELAWERTRVILFSPFDLTKWSIIGFNAFLMLLAEGGVSFNNPFGSKTYNEQFQSVHAFLHSFHGTIEWMRSLTFSPWYALYLWIGVIVLLFWLTLTWVGCRGEFMFLDNVVRNRGAIAGPWNRYAHQGNVWFLFHLLLTLGAILLAVLSLAAVVMFNWSWIKAERNPSGSEVLVLGGILPALALVWIFYAVLLFLIRSFALPLYFTQRVGLVSSLGRVGAIAVHRPLSTVVYILISFVLAVAGGILAMVIFCAACCLVCWLAIIPFLGSILLSAALAQLILPILVFYRCFQLDCLAQFGPEYDVWNVDIVPVSPPPPPG